MSFSDLYLSMSMQQSHGRLVSLDPILISLRWGHTLWLTVSPGTLWNGMNSLRIQREEHGRVCWTYKNENQHIHHNHLCLLSSYSSQFPSSSFCWSPSVHMLSGPIFPGHPPSKMASGRGRFLSTNSSTLGTFGGSSLLSSYSSGHHSSWSHSLLIWWRNLCLCASVAKGYLCALTLGLQIHFFLLHWALIQAREANGRSFKCRRSPGR